MADKSGSIRFLLGREVQALPAVAPTMTVLEYLRGVARRPGTKEGCAEGDCGACTVAIGELQGDAVCYRAVNACIQFVATLDGKQLVTVEDLRAADGSLHPVQQALVERHASQCGFCTPGFVMSLFCLFHAPGQPDRDAINDALAGNLCRCTGYGPIIAAAEQALEHAGDDRFAAEQVRTVAALRRLQSPTTVQLSPAGQRYFAPRDLAELADLLLRHPEACLLGGGTDVGLWVTKQHRRLDPVIYLGNVAALQQIAVTANHIEIGAAATYTALHDIIAAHYPDFAELLRRLGSTQIRNVGTMGGNIANGSPIGDSPPPLIALGATLVLRRGASRRELPLERYFLDYGKQDRQPGELVELIRLPVADPGRVFRCYKLSKRFDQDIAAVLGAFNARLRDGRVGDIRIAFGGMAAIPKRATACEAALRGQPWTRETVERAVAALAADFAPISDFRASRGYRAEAAANLLRKFFVETTETAATRLVGRQGIPCGPAWHDAAPAAPHHGSVQAPLPHDSAHKHVSGEAIYVDDMPEPAATLALHVAGSTVAHAQLKRLDLAQVRAAPGVVAVLAAGDIPGANDVSPIGAGDDPVFAADEIQFHGQALFAVAAESLAQARAAAALAIVEYQPLEAILTIEAALAQRSFVLEPHVMRRGDAAAALATAPQRLAGRLCMGGQEHFYLEGQVSLAVPQEDGDVLVHCSTQHPSEVQHLIAKMLGRADHAVTVEVRRMGGAFGGKETQAAQWAAIAALAAVTTGRPAKCRLDRDDDMIMTGKRHDFIVDYDVGFDADGRLLAIDLMFASRCGFSADLSGAINDRAMFHADNAYYLPNVVITSYRCKTHTVSNTAFRGFGGPQGMMAIEQVMDAIARQVGRDPLDVRRANLYGRGERDVTPYHMTIADNVLPELIGDLELSADYRARRQAVGAYNVANPYLKKGLALTPVKFGISFTTTHLNQAGALIHLYADGSVQLNHGGTEMGQGLFTKVAQVVADELQLDLDRIKITATSTGKVPNTSATAASSGSDLNGMAAQVAARTLKARLVDFAAGHYGVAPDAVRFLRNRVQVGGREVTFPELTRQAYLARVPLSATGFYRTPEVYYDRARAAGQPFYYFAYGAAVSEVVIDTLTGEYKVTRVDILHDVGRSLNPAIDLGQIEGGFIQGMGWLTTEELVWDPQGRLQTHAPSTYKIPACSDRPADFRVRLLQGAANRKPTIHRSKAVGEPPLMLAISVLRALSDAIASLADHRILPALDAPATPERVLRAIGELRPRHPAPVPASVVQA